MMKINFKKLSDTAIAPNKSHYNDSGFDLYADDDVTLAYGETKAIATNIAFHKQFRLLAKAEHLIEEEKRYWLRKIPVPLLDKEGEKKWLWRQRGTDIVGVDTIRVDHEKYQTIFTESEISQMDITGFEKVEVTE